MTSCKRNEHPRCGCKQCVRGGNSKSGNYVHRQINRKIRHVTKSILAHLSDLEDFTAVIISTPYTD